MDWKKFAAQTLTTQDVEKAFLDQAYLQIQNKANPLMRPPHRLGFEIVYKNDANTKMVGIFVFRIGRELYYAPVFFMNGNIKGTDLFYRHATKTFVPLTNEWADYLMHLSQTPEGQPIGREVRSEANNAMDLSSLSQPPMMRKMASEAFSEMCKKAEDMTKEAGESVSILKRFITEDGGHDAIRKIASAAKLDYAFANALFMASDADNFAPELENLEKQAAKAQPDLVIHFNPLFNDNVKSATTKVIADGYMIEDNRKEAAISMTFEPLEETLEGVSEPGIYDVLLADGTRRQLLVAYGDPGMLDACPRVLKSPHYCASDCCADKQFMCVDMENQNSATSPYKREIYGELVHDLNEANAGGSKEVSPGKSYRLLNLTSKKLSGPFVASKVGKTDAGLVEFQAVTGGYKDNENNGIKLIINPDYDGPIDADGVIGKDFRFIPVAHKYEDSGYLTFPSDIQFGDKAALDNFIYGDGYKRASVVRLTQDEFALRRHETEKLSYGMSKLAAKLALMNECNLREATAEEIMATVSEKGSSDFIYKPTVKQAMNLQMPQFPEFYADMSEDFGIPQEDANAMQSYVLAEGEQPNIELHRIGDAMHHEGRNQDSPQEVSLDQLQTATPMGLFQLSQQRGLGNLFEHGVVGSLVKTYDSVALVEKYLPDLEQALDRVGRILFLLYWKPEDFSESYGTDDQNELENQLLSNFKSWGDMVLSFLLKNEKVQKGTSPLQ